VFLHSCSASDRQAGIHRGGGSHRLTLSQVSRRNATSSPTSFSDKSALVTSP